MLVILIRQLNKYSFVRIVEIQELADVGLFNCIRVVLRIIQSIIFWPFLISFLVGGGGGVRMIAAAVNLTRLPYFVWIVVHYINFDKYLIIDRN